jgi:hypothetical protein
MNTKPDCDAADDPMDGACEVLKAAKRESDRRLYGDCSAAVKGEPRIGTTHVLAECRDCSWADDNYKTAAASSLRHADSTGHTVAVERAQSWTYNPKAST